MNASSMNLTWERWRPAGVFAISSPRLAGGTPALPGMRFLDSTREVLLGRILSLALRLTALILGIIFASCDVRAADPAAPRRAAMKNWSASPTDQQGRISYIRGTEARLLPNSLVDVTGMIIETDPANRKNVVIKAARCIYDTRKEIAWGDGELTLNTSDNQIAVRGKGFLWLKKESRLMISNAVETIVQRRPSESLKTASSNEPNLTDAIKITSKSVEYQTDKATFRDNVLATEASGSVRCDTLTIHLGEQGTESLRQIDAEGHVEITQDKSRASGGKATYAIDGEKGVVQLTGEARWRDGIRDVTADLLLLDRIQNAVRAEGHARIKLPRRGLASAGLLTAKKTPPADASANDLVEVSSDLITMKLAANSAQVQQVEARKNVVIADATDGSRATGDLAVYDELGGTLQLSGRPAWESGGRIIRGDTLTIDRTNRVFRSIGNSFVRLPISTLGSASMMQLDAVARKTTASATNQFVELTSDVFEYHTNRLEFRGLVLTRLLEAETRKVEMDCETLILRMGQHLESVEASGNVTLRQIPPPGISADQFLKQITSKTLQAKMRADGRLESLIADGRVRALQITPGRNGGKSVSTKLQSDTIIAQLDAATNRVRQIVAESNVILEQDERSARGERAVYDGGNRILELTGNPSATAAEGRITEADALIWDTGRQQLRVKGKFKSEWNQTAVRAQADPGTKASKAP